MRAILVGIFQTRMLIVVWNGQDFLHDWAIGHRPTHDSFRITNQRVVIVANYVMGPFICNCLCTLGGALWSRAFLFVAR